MTVEYLSCELPPVRDALIIVAEFDELWGGRMGEGFVLTTRPKPFLHMVRVRRSQPIKDVPPEVAEALDVASYLRTWCRDKLSDLHAQRSRPRDDDAGAPPRIILNPVRPALHVRHWTMDEQEVILRRCVIETQCDEVRTALQRILRLPRLEMEVKDIDPAGAKDEEN